jgi:hypothetical protein
MKKDAFKETISNGLQFYFKPKYDAKENLYYVIDGYQNKIKDFTVVQKEKDEKGNSWEISSTSHVPTEIRDLELDFVNAIIAER